MMSLDACFTLQNIGPDGSLCEEFDSVKLSCFLSKYLDELTAYYLTLGLGIGHACKLIQKSVGSIHIDQVCFHLITEYLDNLLGFTLAEQSVINVNTDKIVADSLDEHCSHYG